MNKRRVEMGQLVQLLLQLVLFDRLLAQVVLVPLLLLSLLLFLILLDHFELVERAQVLLVFRNRNESHRVAAHSTLTQLLGAAVAACLWAGSGSDLLVTLVAKHPSLNFLLSLELIVGFSLFSLDLLLRFDVMVEQVV